MDAWASSTQISSITKDAVLKKYKPVKDFTETFYTYKILFILVDVLQGCKMAIF